MKIKALALHNILIHYFQEIQAQKIVVIHPGSLNLRFGRASDLNPFRTLNAVARRRKRGGKCYRDLILPAAVIKVSGNLYLR